MNAHKLARGLGWFSLALGLAELVAPRRLGRALGMEESAGLLRAYGVREIASGIGILAQPHPTPWVWSRVAGDALDLATLGTALRGRSRRPRSVMTALGLVAGVTVLDVLCGSRLQRS